MKFTFTKSQFEMPDGRYLAKFLGCTMKDLQPGESPRIGMDGKPMPPAMTWDFEIVEGDQKGKKCDKLTGRVPTPKSGCGKMLSAIADTVLKDGIEVDIANYVGKLYRITVAENRVTENPPPIRVYDHEPSAAQVQNQWPALWDVADGENNMTSQDTTTVQRLIEAGADPLKLWLKPAGADAKQAKTAAGWGFKKPEELTVNGKNPF